MQALVESRKIAGISSGLLQAEEELLSGATGLPTKPVFILGAPRTGSTVLYQAIIHAFGLPYISNLTNQDFPQTPIFGLAIQRWAPRDIGLESHFGKTKGIFGPSEGSAVMSRWFGGGHPSQTASSWIIPGQEEHFVATMAAVERLYGGKPLLIKNAWNCFRIACLAELLPQAKFIWIRRDMREAAESDLEARYLTKGAPDIWNSATPSNVEALRSLPPFQQVVENQYEFNKAIDAGLNSAADGRFVTVWYEDLLADASGVLARIGELLGIDAMQTIDQADISGRASRQISASNAVAIKRYVDANMGRLASHCYRGGEDG